MRVLPESYLKCMSAEDRKAIGQSSASETLAKAEVKNEKELQKAVVNLLRLKGIVPIVSRMDRRTSNNLGTPDILFAAVQKGFIDFYGDTSRAPATHAVAFEVKFGKGQLSNDQEHMSQLLTCPPNSWKHFVIRSVDEAIEVLRALGIEESNSA